MNIKTIVTLGSGAAAAMIGAVPSHATVTLCTGNNCVATNENVNITAATNKATIFGTTATTNMQVLFTSSTDTLNGNANGQADVSSTDGLLNSITFALAGGATFSSATFNLFPLPGNQANEATSVIISYFNPAAGTYGSQTIDTNGNNFLGITGTAGERFTSVTFIGNPATTGISDLRQLRLGGVMAAVPEPSTWAMMFTGLAMVAGVARSRRRRTAFTFA